MRVRTLVILSVVFFILGGVGGAAYGVVNVLSGSGVLPKLSFNDLAPSLSAEDKMIEDFIEEQEALRPDGMQEINVSGFYVQPEVDQYGNLVTAAPQVSSGGKSDSNTTANTPASGSSAGTGKTGHPTVKDGTTLRLRSEPNTGSEVLGGIYNTDKVTILAEKGGWYQIETANGIKAWVSADYIELD